MKRIFIAMLIGCAALQATAQAAQEGVTIKAANFYFGGGIGYNSLPGFGKATGIQFLGGYRFDGKMNGDISTALELGYMDTGNFDRPSSNWNGSTRTADDANGLWLNLVESVPIGNRVSGLVRAGFDFGDDDGLMIGAGLDYAFNQQFSLRTEYVSRDSIDSFQFNVLIRL